MELTLEITWSKSFAKFLGVSIPEGDGQAERFMRNLNDSLAILCDQNVGQWHTFIPGVQYAYNTTTHSVISITPFEMVYGRKPQPLSTEFLISELSPKCRTQKQYVHQLRNVITNVHERARQHILNTWIKMAQRYNLQRRELRITTGQYVLVRLHAGNIDPLQETGNKLAMRWSNPARVIGTKSNGKTFDVQHQNGTNQVVNASHLLPLPQACWNPTRFTFRQILRDVDTAFLHKPNPDSSPWVTQQPTASISCK